MRRRWQLAGSWFMVHGAYKAFGGIRIVCARYHFAKCIFMASSYLRPPL